MALNPKVAAKLAAKKPAVVAKKPVAAAAEEVVEEVTETVEEVTEQVDDVPVDEQVDENGEPIAEAEPEPAPVVAKKPVGRPAKAPAAPVAAKVVAKPVVAAKPAPAVAAKPAAKPVVAAKVAPKVAAKPAKAAAEPVEKGKSMFSGARKAREARVYEDGSWLPRDELMHRFQVALQVDEEFKDVQKSQLDRLIGLFENFIVEILQNHDIRLFGIKTKRSYVADRLYEPTTALDKVATNYHTLVSAHTKVSITWAFDKTSTHGALAEDGSLIEGRWEEDGEFTPGTWINKQKGEFTPAE